MREQNKMIKWNIEKADAVLIKKIVARVLKIYPQASAMTVDMDLTACHLNGCPLDLKRLLAAPHFDFVHDVGGINRHIDRETGKLTRCFLPRTALPEPKKLAA